MNLPLIVKKDEPRIDSRVLAEHLGIEHPSLMRLIRDFRADFEQFGIIGFEIRKIASRGRPEQSALLNEDQCYLLLTYSRNTKKVRALKGQLVRAFREARLAAELKAEYLPTYRAMHDQLTRFHEGSRKDRFLHMNINKLVNAVAGIESGQRATAPMPRKALQIVAQHLACKAMQGATDGHEAYAAVKSAVAPLSVTPLIGG